MTNIAFITFGCTLNFADTELMMGLLAKAGYKIVDSADKADLVVVNGCSVKSLAETKFFRAIRDAKKKEKKIIVAGCVAQAEPAYLDTKLLDFSVIGTKQLNRIVHVVEETLQGNKVHLLGDGKNQRHELPKIRRNSAIGIIPIAEGCLGNCSYCKARFARGKLVSYAPQAIIKQTILDVKQGCKEIWLTSQDCGAYGKDIGTSIVELLRAVLEIDGKFMVRIGMTNPNFVVEYLDDLIDIFKHNKGKLFWFIHLPVQSGNDRILKLMRRKYSVSDFENAVARLRKELPQITIATDFICGFPTETKEEFQESLNLLSRTKPDVVNISRFWARPGTDAAKMEGQLIGRETNPRSREMRKIFEELVAEQNKMWLGWQGEIIIDETGKIGEEESYIGRNFAYKPVAVKGKYSIGQAIKVRIKKTSTHHLEAVEIK